MSGDNAGRVPPHSEEAEKAVLGAIMLDGWKWMSLAQNQYRLSADSFYVPAYRLVWESCCRLIVGGRPIDLTLVANDMRTVGTLDAAGGPIALDRLVDSALPTNVGHHMDIVRQKFILRETETVVRQILEDSRKTDKGDELLSSVPARFGKIIDEACKEKSNVQVMADSIQRWRDVHDKKISPGIMTPWHRFNQLLGGGMRPGMIILAGRPSQGKTTVEDCISTFVASQGMAVARITLDSTKDELLERALCRKAGVSMPKLNFGFAGQSQLAEIEESARVLGAHKTFIERYRILDSIITWVRMMKIKHDIQLFTLDYVQQVMTGDGHVDNNENLRITLVSAALKALSLELKIPFIIISQLSRQGETADRQPKLSDLRGSGSLEQDASQVWFVSRDKDAMDQEGTKARPTWIEQAKNKNGEIGSIEFWFYANYFRFDEASPGAFGSTG